MEKWDKEGKAITKGYVMKHVLIVDNCSLVLLEIFETCIKSLQNEPRVKRGEEAGVYIYLSVSGWEMLLGISFQIFSP